MNPLQQARLRFLCRRGMKELDETLQPFFDQHFAKLPRKLQEDFARLLDQEDPTLWDWLVIKKEGVSTEFRDIVERIISK